MVRRALLLSVVLAAAVASAQSRRRPPEVPWSLGVKLGVQLNPWVQPVAPVGVLRLGYQLPLLQRRFELFADLSFATPAIAFAPTRVRDLSMAVGLTFWLVEPTARVAPYLSLAPRLHVLFIEQLPWLEVHSRVGVSVAGGVGFRLGVVGRVLIEPGVEVLVVDAALTGPTDLTAVALRVGYSVLW